MVSVNAVSNEVKRLLSLQGDKNTLEKISDISYLVCSQLVEQGQSIEGEFAVWCSGPMLESLTMNIENYEDSMKKEVKDEILAIYNQIMGNSYSDAEFSLMTSLYDEAWNRAYAEKRTHIPWEYVK